MSDSDNHSVVLQRPAFAQPPLHTPSPLKFNPGYDIKFCHPGYPDPYNILLILPGLDHPEGGIYHRAALWSCGIIANNQFNSYLSEDREGHVRVTTPLDGILRKRSYYFQVQDEHSHPYPIVPSFETWSFPHGKLPADWKFDIPDDPSHPISRQSTLAGAVLSRDLRCRLTNHIEGTECAHLVPRNQGIWFQRNMMDQYGRLSRLNCDAVDTTRNVLLLRSDIHTSFDDKRFTFIPKPKNAPINRTESTTGRPRAYVTHIFKSTKPHELTALYHNVTLQGISEVAPEYLFARLAWTVFENTDSFLQAGVARRLAIHDACTGATEAGSGFTISTKTYTAEQCFSMSFRSKSRSLSVKKRKQDGTEDDGSISRGRTRLRHNDILTPSFVSSIDSEGTGDGPWNPESPGEQTDASDMDEHDDTPGADWADN
ncbi:hypothetical protein BDV25DRAFT_136181 [Aspergillus avenaceus]|uniref:HNH nuclease domain-containing protein n=1 Tax=Aspergillus avenaceus TaxID=36643 RepID=A0A5N6U6J5_ASPAV|nr:hypothetical protein BDV25DRAFT_136181 [Aspergillus avenaceus]